MYADPKYRQLPLEAITLLNEGQLIEAIKVVRETEKLGLKEARDRVYAYVETEPLLKAQMELRQRAARRRLFFWFLVFDAVIVAAVIYWLRFRGAA